MTFSIKNAVTRGFTLIEVLVASLLIMVGVTGYVTLQSDYVVADANLNLRITALRLAQEKITDLGYFQQLDDYHAIHSNIGGSIPAGEIEIPLSTELNLHTYTLQWQVEDRYFVDTNYDDIADTWVKIGESFYPTALPRYPHLKRVKISVSWVDDSAKSKKIDLYCSLAPLAKGQSFHSKYRTPSVFATP